MSDIQKVIKYLAMVFAIFLIVSIFSGIISLVLIFGSIFDNSNVLLDDYEVLETDGIIEVLDIEVSSVNVIIKEDTVFKIETNNKRVDLKQEGNKVLIEEEGNFLFNNTKTGDLIIYVPEVNNLSDVSLESGAGRVEIESFTTNNLLLDLGAGKVEINDLVVLEKSKIDGGIGEIDIKNSTIHNLDLDIGVGKVSFLGSILGVSEIDCGVAETTLDLIGTTSDYKITIDKGIGNVKVDGNSVTDSSYYGNGNNLIEINGGIGSIKVDFIEKENYF